MSDQQSSYRQIIKATSIFGGVQVIQIIIQIIRSKALAVLLGPAGMGINSLLNSTLQLVQSFTSFGLKTSAVKNVAEANGTSNANRVAVIITVLQRWVWITGLFGATLTLILSPWLSELTFGDREYTTAFVWISISLLFNQITAGQLVVLQGLRKIHYLANANLTGAFLGLLVSIPLYYYLDVDGIVPAIIAVSFANMIRSWYFARKIKIGSPKVSATTTLTEGKQMLIMGFMLSLSGLMTTGAAYILRIFISNTGGIEQVGLYSAGFAIINTYVGMVFSAMATDYYPRLSAVSNSNLRAKQTINQQAEITILLLAPILAVFLVFINWAVILLYSTKFIDVTGMIQWAALGMFFKAGSWSIGFIFMAKGATKLFFWNELITNIYLLVLNVLGYKYGGLDGLGISFLIAYFLHLIQVFVFARLKYTFSFESGFMKIFTIQLLLGLFCFIITKFSSEPLSYILGTVFIIVSGVYSIIELNKRIDLKSFLKRIKR